LNAPVHAIAVYSIVPMLGRRIAALSSSHTTTMPPADPHATQSLGQAGQGGVRAGRALVRAAGLLLAAAMPHVAIGATRSAPPPPGHTREVVPQRTDEAPVIDGRLSEPVWRSAARAERFWISEWRQAPSDPTVVQILYDDQALYFAFFCFDAEPSRVQAVQLTRDSAMAVDDRVTVELDPYHNHRSLSRFTVTARGTQSDAIAGGRARKIEWKGDWSAAAQRTSFGWTAEIAIPFAILDFTPGADTFGVNFIRYQGRTQEWSQWADLTPQNLPEEAGHLVGLRLPDAAAAGATKLAVMQYASAGARPPARGPGPGARDSTSAIRPGVSRRS
jgi:hypothetical protein